MHLWSVTYNIMRHLFKCNSNTRSGPISSLVTSPSTNSKFSCSHCCQISQVLTHHSCNQVSPLVKCQGTYWVQASLSHLYSFYYLSATYLFKLVIVQPPRLLSPYPDHLLSHLSFRKPDPHPGLLPSHYPTQVRSTLSSPPLSPSITSSLFHSRLKTHLFLKSFPP